MKTYVGVVIWSEMVEVQAESEGEAYDLVWEHGVNTRQRRGLSLSGWHIKEVTTKQNGNSESTTLNILNDNYEG